MIKNGGISKVIPTKDEEKENVKYVEYLDNLLLDFRNKLRLGEVLKKEDIEPIVKGVAEIVETI